MVISDWEILFRLLVAAALGAVVGIERERSKQPAGLRTHIILAVGSALAMTLSINMAIQFAPLIPPGDPARIAAQVVSGIGFLGAGAILRYGTSVKGLTTATSLWTLAIVGMVVGSGHYVAAIGTTLLLLLALVILNVLEHRLINPNMQVALTISAEDRAAMIKDLKRVLELRTVKFSRFTIQKNIRRKTIRIQTAVEVKDEAGIEILMSSLSEINGMRAFKIV
jgi:putative Mg2+ transporter-C (MgtC) family protein